MDYTLKNIFNTQAELGEGPFWNSRAQQLGWVNILEGELHFLNPQSGDDQFVRFNEYIGFAVPRVNGDILVGLQRGIASYNLTGAQLSWIAQPEKDKAGNRFNDGKCSPDGRLFAGTMAVDEHAEAGALYRLDKNLSMQKVIAPVSISNGLAWSPEMNTLYYIDTPTRNVVAFEYNFDNGSIKNPKIVVTIPAEAGWPDGMTIDAEGMLWIALWNGAKIIRYNPGNGKKISEISLPALNVTSCAFGGPDLTNLYVTSAWKGMNPEQRKQFPGSGDIFEIETKIQGIPLHIFQG